ATKQSSASDTDFETVATLLPQRHCRSNQLKWNVGFHAGKGPGELGKYSQGMPGGISVPLSICVFNVVYSETQRLGDHFAKIIRLYPPRKRTAVSGEIANSNCLGSFISLPVSSVQN